MLSLTQPGPVFPLLALCTVVVFLLLCGAVVHSDFTRRRIPNAYCVTIAGMAVLWWLGQHGWPGMLAFGWHLIVPLIAAVPLLILFGLRILAGGDVKLILALLLWVPQSGAVTMVILLMLGGGILAVALKLLKLVFRRIDADTVPYGVAIVAGALIMLIPDFRDVVKAVPMFG